MIKIECTANKAWCTEKDKLTSGSKGLKVEFVFSDEWDDLEKLAVFKAFDRVETVPIDLDNIAEIPAGVMELDGVLLTVGVYGTNIAGDIVIPTVYAGLGLISRGVLASEGRNFDSPAESTSALILKLAKQAQYAATIAASGTGAAEITFSISGAGHLIEHRSGAEDEAYDVDLGPVTSYAQAVEAGYEGTKDEFITLILANGETLTDVRQTIEAVQNVTATANEAKSTAATAQSLAQSASNVANDANTKVTSLNSTVNGKQAKHKTATVTLDKSVKTWTKSCSGVTANNAVICSPAPASYAQWTANEIRCTAQASNQLTFTATTAPTAAVTVNVLIFD